MTAKSPNSCPPRDHPVRVSFDDQPAVLMIPPVEDLSGDEVETLWYSKDDQEELIEEALDVANGWNYEGDATRGLEKMNKEGNAKTQALRRQIVRAVLREQDRLRESVTDSEDPSYDTALADISSKLSASCQDQAYERAYEDELESLPRNKAPLRRTSSSNGRRGRGGLLSRMIGDSIRSLSPPRFRLTQTR